MVISFLPDTEPFILMRLYFALSLGVKSGLLFSLLLSSRISLISAISLPSIRLFRLQLSFSSYTGNSVSLFLIGLCNSGLNFYMILFTDLNDSIRVDFVYLFLVSTLKLFMFLSYCSDSSSSPSASGNVLICSYFYFLIPLSTVSFLAAGLTPWVIVLHFFILFWVDSRW